MSDYYKGIDETLVKGIIRPRLKMSRKGDNGIVLVIGGSRIYHGAPILSSIAAFRSGTDLVYTAIPKINLVSSRTYSPDLIFLPLPDDKLTMGSSRKLFSLMPKKVDSAAIGMGLSFSKDDSLLFLINKLLEIKTRLIVDAAALIPRILNVITNSNTVITPHLGEFTRMFGEKSSSTNLLDQISCVSKKAKEYGIVIVLKGYWNIVSDGENTYVLERSTPAMTVGGMGDILSGLIAGYLTKYNSVESSILGLYFNGMAGLNLFNRSGLHVVASDFLTELPHILKKYDRIE